MHCNASLPLRQCIQLHNCCQNATPPFSITACPVYRQLTNCNCFTNFKYRFSFVWSGNGHSYFICRIPTEVQDPVSVMCMMCPIQGCPYFLLWYISTESTSSCCRSHVLALVQGRSLSPIITFTRMVEVFPSLSTRELSSSVIKRKKANCRCISRSCSLFPLSPERSATRNNGQKKIFCIMGPVTLTWQCDQRDNFPWTRY